MTGALFLIDLLAAIDQPFDPGRPETWTRCGRPLSAKEVARVRAATLDDWMCVHDMAVLDGATCHDHDHGPEAA